MIRKQVEFSVINEAEIAEISYNYQHEVLINIYNLMKLADEKKAKILHNKGFRVGSGHVFKLFNYTLLFEDAKFTKTGILCNNKYKIKLIISGKKEVIENILRGLLVSPRLEIEKTTFQLKGVQDDKRINLREVTFYKTLSPIIVSTKTDGGEREYLNPYNPKYFENLASNLKRKYSLIYNKEYKGEIFFEIDDLLEMKDKFIKIKQGGVGGQRGLNLGRGRQGYAEGNILFRPWSKQLNRMWLFKFHNWGER